MCNGFTGWNLYGKSIGIANLPLFSVIVFVYTLDNSVLIWIMIAIESGCYFGCSDSTSTYSQTSALILISSQM
jgi:hypothetical protein